MRNRIDADISGKKEPQKAVKSGRDRYLRREFL